MPAECPYGGSVCKKKCVLISSAENQAKQGHAGGPLPRDSWDSFRARSRATARAEGCVDPQAVDDAFEDLTRRVYGG